MTVHAAKILRRMQEHEKVFVHVMLNSVTSGTPHGRAPDFCQSRIPLFRLVGSRTSRVLPPLRFPCCLCELLFRQKLKARATRALELAHESEPLGGEKLAS